MARTDILILSDTHGRSDFIQKATRLVRPHLIIFCGDGLRDFDGGDYACPVYAVRGNCDWLYVPHMGDVEESMTLNLDGLKLFITHGHRFGVKGGLGALISRAVQEDADAVIFGHTHEALEMTLLPENTKERFGISLNKPLHLFNPGSLGYDPHSFGTLTIKDGVPLFGHGHIKD